MPAFPMMTLPLKTRGAPVIEYGATLLSTVGVSHRGLPVFALSAMSRPSRVAIITLPSYTAGPRLTTSQQTKRLHSGGTFGSYFHSSLPVRASSAYVIVQAEVRYITP